jgi:O-antigen ligase
MPPREASQSTEPREGIFAGAVGLWLALALIKFGNPVILADQIAAPTDRDELLFAPWPLEWGYVLLALCVLLGLGFYRRPKSVPAGLVALPFIWLGWQGLSALQTVDRTLTAPTLAHFAASVVAFYLGLFAFPQVHRLRAFWAGLIGGFVVVLLIGLRQHFGGLEETRRFFYSLPDWPKYPPDFLKKVASDRIYSTLFYPNTLAGVILLLLPVSWGVLWNSTRNAGTGIRAGMLGGLGAAALACLYWSGSKAGWLIALALGVVALLESKVRKSLKIGLTLGLACIGLVGFWVANRGYFAKGATSVSARFDYWSAAWQTMKSKPFLGTGPGTFMHPYQKLKAPDAEMSRLAHNDYLQQGSDSGFVGMVTYTAFVFFVLGLLYWRRLPMSDWRFAVWLGVLGIGIQGFVEFGLYIPATAWTMFFLSGWLLGSPNGKPFDKAKSDS